MKQFIFSLLILFTFSLWADDLSDALTKADELSKKAQYTEAARVLLDYMKNTQDNPLKIEMNYSIACYYSLAKKPDLAFKYLKTAINQGFLDKDWIVKDTDFTNIHKDKRWQTHLALIDKNYQAKISTLPDKHNFAIEIVLPEPNLKSETSVEQALNQRRSIREYSDEALTLDEVSQILWSAYGVSKAVAPDRLRGGLKTAPSAGATYPLELYLGAWNVKGLDPGFYYYEPNGHKLQLTKKGDFRKELCEACMGQEYVQNAPASLVYSAIYERTTKRYGDRGRERYVCMDLGHSAENVYLQVETLNMGTVAIGAFSDLKLKLIVSMTKAEEPLYVMPIGKKKK